MAWFKGLFGKEEDEQPIAAGTSAEPVAAAANTNAVAQPKATGKKINLNFKAVPKQVVAAIAAETTGQPQPIAVAGTATRGRKGSLSGAFNQAAGMLGADTDDLDDRDGQGGNAGQGFVLKDPPPARPKVTIKLPAPKPY